MNDMKIFFDKKRKLIPVIIQDNTNARVLMLGYMNNEALTKTKETGVVYFWSRSRNALWKKGELSGNTLSVRSICADCDADTLLIRVTVNGRAVCHTGSNTCFFTPI